jgi:hypothetical protein
MSMGLSKDAAVVVIREPHFAELAERTSNTVE